VTEKSLKIVGRAIYDGNGGMTLPLGIIGAHGEALTIRVTLAGADFKKQQREPIQVMEGSFWWLFQQVVVDAGAIGVVPSEHHDELLLRVKHFVLRHEKVLSRARREVEAYENRALLPIARREAIPDSVRMFVWQRDEGRCVKCGSKEKLEFDHIIPVADGGGSTSRNIQLLCETCNRVKGRSVVSGADGD